MKQGLLKHALSTIASRHGNNQLQTGKEAAQKKGEGVGEVVYQDLLHVQQSYLQEAKLFQDKRFVHSHSMHLNGREKSKRLLYLFQKDLMPGISGQILESKENREKMKVKSVSKTAKGLAWTFLVLLDAGMLFYIFLFAVSQNEYRQTAWAQSFAVWLIAEVFLVSTCMVLITHIAIPSIIMKDVQAIKSKLVDSLVQYHQLLQSEKEKQQDGGMISNDNETGEKGKEKKGDVFNAAEYLFVSYKLAKAFPQVKTAQIISHYQTVWPRQSYQHVVDVSKSYDRKFTALTQSASMVVLFFVSNLLTVPVTIQDMVLQMVTTIVTGYTFLIHVQLFHIYPVLIIVPSLCIGVVVHFLLQSHHRHQQHAAMQLLIQGSKEKDKKAEGEGGAAAAGERAVVDAKAQTEKDSLGEEEAERKMIEEESKNEKKAGRRKMSIHSNRSEDYLPSDEELEEKEDVEEGGGEYEEWSGGVPSVEYEVEAYQYDYDYDDGYYEYEEGYEEGGYGEEIHFDARLDDYHEEEGEGEVEEGGWYYDEEGNLINQYDENIKPSGEYDDEEGERGGIHYPRDRSLSDIFSSSSSSAILSSHGKGGQGDVTDDGEDEEEGQDEHAIDLMSYLQPASTSTSLHVPAGHRTRRQSLQQGVDLLQLAQSFLLPSKGKEASTSEGRRPRRVVRKRATEEVEEVEEGWRLEQIELKEVAEEKYEAEEGEAEKEHEEEDHVISDEKFEQLMGRLDSEEDEEVDISDNGEASSSDSDDEDYDDDIL